MTPQQLLDQDRDLHRRRKLLQYYRPRLFELAADLEAAVAAALAAYSEAEKDYELYGGGGSGIDWDECLRDSNYAALKVRRLDLEWVRDNLGLKESKARQLVENQPDKRRARLLHYYRTKPFALAARLEQIEKDADTAAMNANYFASIDNYESYVADYEELSQELDDLEWVRDNLSLKEDQHAPVVVKDLAYYRRRPFELAADLEATYAALKDNASIGADYAQCIAAFHKLGRLTQIKDALAEPKTPATNPKVQPKALLNPDPTNPDQAPLNPTQNHEVHPANYTAKALVELAIAPTFDPTAPRPSRYFLATTYQYQAVVTATLQQHCDQLHYQLDRHTHLGPGYVTYIFNSRQDRDEALRQLVNHAHLPKGALAQGTIHGKPKDQPRDLEDN